MNKDYISNLPKEIDANGCWIFQGALQHDGYGLVKIKSLRRLPIRLNRLIAFVYYNLDLNNEKQLALHKLECKSKACFNPEHIYVGTAKDNSRDLIISGSHNQTRRVHCVRGHLLDGERLDRRRMKYIRYCKTCNRAWANGNRPA